MENSKTVFGWLNPLTDILFAVLSMALAFWFRFVVFGGENPVGGFDYHVLWAALFSPVYVILYVFLGVYDLRHERSFLKHLGRLILGNTIATMLYIDLVFVFRVVDFSRWLIVLSYIIMNFLTGVKAFLLHRRAWRRRVLGLDTRGILVVGHGEAAGYCIRRISECEDCGCRVMGSVGHAPIEGVEYLGVFDDIDTIVERVQPDEILIALDNDESRYVKSVLFQCENCGVKISLLPGYHEYISSRPIFEDLAGMPLVNVRKVALDNRGYALLKRMMDVLLSLLMIVVTSPIMLAAVVGTKLSSPGPVIFRQTRIGLNRKEFEMYKFRSMCLNDSHESAWTTDGDPRRTRFGAFMRRYSIDELPQLFNVLKGDMSLVGPRPEIPYYVDHFKYSVSLYMVRHQVRPGMTGWAQVNGLRGDSSIPERVKYDLFYLENWSILFDLKILLMTPFRGIVNEKETLKIK